MIYTVDEKSTKGEIEKYRIRNYAWTDRPTFTSFPNDKNEYNDKNDHEAIEELRGPSLTGFHNFIGRNSSKAKKWFWLLVYVCCLTLFLVQTGERLNYYLQYPMGMTLNLEKRLTWKYPDITICPFHGFRSGRILQETLKLCNEKNINESDCNENHFYELLNSEFDLQQIWSMSGESIWNTIVECKYEADKLCNSSEFWRSEVTVMGTCYTLSIADEIVHGGPWLGIDILLHNAKQFVKNEIKHLKWKVFLHENDTVIEYTAYTRSHMIYKDCRTVMMFWKKVYEYVNTPINPCVSNEEVQTCLFKCFDQNFLNGSSCKLPFMKTLDLPLCTRPDEFSNLYKVPVHLNTFQNDISACHCGRSCRQTSYDVQTDSKTEHSAGHNRIIVYPTQPEIEIINERQAYPIISLFSDIGGALGLYLGVCILTILELFNYMSKVTFRSIKASMSSANGAQCKPIKNDKIKHKF